MLWMLLSPLLIKKSSAEEMMAKRKFSVSFEYNENNWQVEITEGQNIYEMIRNKIGLNRMLTFDILHENKKIPKDNWDREEMMKKMNSDDFVVSIANVREPKEWQIDEGDSYEFHSYTVEKDVSVRCRTGEDKKRVSYFVSDWIFHPDNGWIWGKLIVESCQVTFAKKKTPRSGSFAENEYSRFEVSDAFAPLIIRDEDYVYYFFVKAMFESGKMQFVFKSYDPDAGSLCGGRGMNKCECQTITLFYSNDGRLEGSSREYKHVLQQECATGKDEKVTEINRVYL